MDQGSVSRLLPLGELLPRGGGESRYLLFYHAAMQNYERFQKHELSLDTFLATTTLQLEQYVDFLFSTMKISARRRRRSSRACWRTSTGC